MTFSNFNAKKGKNRPSTYWNNVAINFVVLLISQGIWIFITDLQCMLLTQYV